MARLKGFRKLVSVDEASRIFFANLEMVHLKSETLPLQSALDRVSAENLVAKTDLPMFDRSAVDGYAVKAEDTVDATQFNPKMLRLTNEETIGSEHAKKVWTGTVMPRGADAVVMLENTAHAKDNVQIWVSVTPGENVSKRGEDIQKDEIAVQAGTRLRPQHLGLLAALGTVQVKVFRKPTIAVLATGNELAEVGHRLRNDQVYDVNRLVLSSMCLELGAEPLDLGIAEDDAEEIKKKLKIGLEKAEAVLTTGGTSVGVSDLVPETVCQMGPPGILVHGVAMRPGMPTALASVDGKAVIILPGNPVAAMVGFEVFVRPLICRMLGMSVTEPRFVVQAKVTRRIATTLGRRTFVRAHIFQQNGEFFADPVSSRGSSMISTMTRANGFVVVPENREGLEQGELVSVQMFDEIKMAEGKDVQKTVDSGRDPRDHTEKR